MSEVALQENSLAGVLEKALENNQVTPELLNGFLDFQERLDLKRAEQEFNRSLTKAIAEIPDFEKMRQGHNSKYTPFEVINHTVKPILQRNDLYLTFYTSMEEPKTIDVTAKITHVDGFSQKTIMRLPFDTSGNKNDVQSVGSAVSYGKRYTMCALLNITTHNEDDDGFASSKKIDKDQIGRINNGILASGVSLEKLCKYMDVDNIGEILLTDYTKALGYLSQAVKEKENQDDSK